MPLTENALPELKSYRLILLHGKVMLLIILLAKLLLVPTVVQFIKRLPAAVLFVCNEIT